MNSKHDITSFSQLASGANFYLNEAFHYINEALSDEYSGIILSNKLKEIEISDDDQKIIENLSLPNDPVELLQADIPTPLTEDTLEKISQAWFEAQELSKIKNHKFGINHPIKSIQILGHLNNYGFFLETLINRHLLFLKQTNSIDNLSYSRISVAKIMDRIIFIFKEDLANSDISINEIVNLFSLRNKTVHYTPDNAITLKPKISELIRIWEQSILIIQKFETNENFEEHKFSEIIDENIKAFKRKWT